MRSWLNRIGCQLAGAHSTGARSLLLAASLLIFTSSARAEDAAIRTLKAQIARWAPIKIRLAKDKRIGFLEDGNTIQTCLTLSESQTPYIVTLGWFTRTKQAGIPESEPDQQEFVDEMGGLIPMPGVKKSKTGLDDADRHSLQAFDMICDGNMEGAVVELNDAIKHSPSSPRLHNNLAVVLAMTGKNSQAQTEFDQALNEKPEYAVALANRAWLALDTKVYEEALKYGQDALKLSPNLHAAQRVIVRAYLKLGKPQEANKMLEVLKQSWPGDSQDMMLLGDVQMALGQVRQAKQTYSQPLFMQSRDVELELKAAKASEQGGDLDEAIKRARAATEAAPTMPEAHLALGRYLEQNRELKAALLQYQRALDVKPVEAVKVTIYGPYLRVLIKMNMLQDADKFSKKWVQENAGRADCHFNRAWVLSQLGNELRLQEAVSEYRKALAIDPSQSSAHYNLARLLVKLKQTEEARTELENFVKAAPNDPDAKQARQLIDKLAGK